MRIVLALERSQALNLLRVRREYRKIVDMDYIGIISSYSLLSTSKLMHALTPELSLEQLCKVKLVQHANLSV